MSNHTYIVDGHRLDAVTIQARDANLPAIVMLHEGLGSVSHWKSFPAQLADKTGAGVFVYSRYGHGRSDPIEAARSVSYMHREAQVVLPELLRQALIENPVLLGHSDGASIATIYAGTFPDSPRALILEAPHVFVEEISISSIAEARDSYLHTDLPSRLARYHSHPDSLFWAWNNIWLNPDFRGWNIESFLAAIRCPVLVLQGAQDEYGTLRQVQAIQSKVTSDRWSSSMPAGIHLTGISPTRRLPRSGHSSESFGNRSAGHSALSLQRRGVGTQ